MEDLPDETGLAATRDMMEVTAALQLPEKEKIIALHRIAQQLLEKGETAMALAVLWLVH
jgi:hypothetical protein